MCWFHILMIKIYHDFVPETYHHHQNRRDRSASRLFIEVRVDRYCYQSWKNHDTIIKDDFQFKFVGIRISSSNKQRITYASYRCFRLIFYLCAKWGNCYCVLTFKKVTKTFGSTNQKLHGIFFHLILTCPNTTL